MNGIIVAENIDDGARFKILIVDEETILEERNNNYGYKGSHC